MIEDEHSDPTHAEHILKYAFDTAEDQIAILAQSLKNEQKVSWVLSRLLVFAAKCRSRLTLIVAAMSPVTHVTSPDLLRMTVAPRTTRAGGKFEKMISEAITICSHSGTCMNPLTSLL